MLLLSCELRGLQLLLAESTDNTSIGRVARGLGRLDWKAIEAFQRNFDVILGNDPLQLATKILVQLVRPMSLFLRAVAVVNANFLLRVVLLHGLSLIDFEEVNHKKWVFEVNEEVAHVGLSIGLFFVADDVEAAVHILVSLVQLILQLFLTVPAWNVLDTQVGPQIFALFDKFDPNRFTGCSSVRFRSGAVACIL